MSEVLELAMEFVGNVIGGLLEIWAGDWMDSSRWPDTKGSRIFWGAVLVILGGIIWWELR